MKRHSTQEILKIKNFRLRYKYSYAHISRISGIPQTTIGHWFRGDEKIPKEETLLLRNIRNRYLLKISETDVLHKVALRDKNNAKLWAAIMYWCEGAKYPSSNRVDIANSDIELIKTFIYLLRKGFTLDESKFSVHLQIHNTQNFEDIKAIWSRELHIPSLQFLRPTITKATGGKHRTTYIGTCNLNYRDYKLQLKLIGLYESFVKKLGLSYESNH
jgi:hypothetical protein